MTLQQRRLDVLASVTTRLAMGAYPVAFLLVFGWAYGKQAFDLASAANNWANYLNVLLLGGFVLVPPALARLRGAVRAPADLAAVRDHVALERLLLCAGAGVAVLLWATIERAFPALAAQGDAPLGTWFVLFAALALAQVPLTLWLGVAQAAARYRAAALLVVVPRVVALTVLLAGAAAGAGPTATLGAAVATVIAGQWMLGRAGRTAVNEIDPAILREPGNPRRVLTKNLSAGAVVLVGTLVTIAPVSIVGHVLPQEVGHAHVIVSLSNAVGAVIVAAFFPLSLTLGEAARKGAGLVGHCVRVARGAMLIAIFLVAAAWLLFPLCGWLSAACTVEPFAVGSLVVFGAGLRLGSLGAHHAGLYMGHPHYALLSAAAEAVAVVGLTWWLLGSWMLYALGAAFIVGGALRLLVAFTFELRWLVARSR